MPNLIVRIGMALNIVNDSLKNPMRPPLPLPFIVTRKPEITRKKLSKL
jgi:hypothetical protein